MADRTGIQWTDATWNPTIGCSRVSAGCQHCYAERLAPRLGHEGIVRSTPRGPEWTGKILVFPERLDIPLRWRKPRRVFVDSMSDLFHPNVPSDFVERAWAVMAAAPQHTFQVLTKRPERMAAWLAAAGWKDEGSLLYREVSRLLGRPAAEAKVPWPLRNVWIGTSVEDQAAADERVPHLLRAPAAVRFLSCEPLLGPVDLDPWVWGDRCPDPQCRDSTWDHVCELGEQLLHWVIVGGESGPDARPFDIAWARGLIRKCRAAGVPCFVKQLGAVPVERFDGIVGPQAVAGVRALAGVTDGKGGDPAEWPQDLCVREFPGVRA